MNLSITNLTPAAWFLRQQDSSGTCLSNSTHQPSLVAEGAVAANKDIGCNSLTKHLHFQNVGNDFFRLLKQKVRTH